MEDKIEVGEYVRTTNGEIGKVRVIIQHMVFINENQYFHDLNKIKSHSKNIIDLIEEGDYVNGELVSKIYNKGEKYEFSSNYIFKEKTIETDNDNYETIPFSNLYINSDIKTIVTKEQFSDIEYKVGE